jgi:hypothetical protein
MTPDHEHDDRPSSEPARADAGRGPIALGDRSDRSAAAWAARRVEGSNGAGAPAGDDVRVTPTPPVDTKPATDTKPTTDAKPATDTKPTTDEKPVVEKPVVDPKTTTDEKQPAADTKTEEPDADGKRRRGSRLLGFRRRHKILTGVLIVILPLLALVGFTWVRAMTKAGTESFVAKNAEWARDMHLGFFVDWLEQRQVESQSDDIPNGGAPDVGLLAPVGAEPAASTTSSSAKGQPTTTLRPHTPAPTKMPTPAPDPLPGEGDWLPAGPDVGGGVHGVYYTKVRPNAEKTSLLVFAAWIDPKVTAVRLFPGTDLPGGTWLNPPQIPADQCSQAIAAFNSGFRMDQARGGYYAEGRESNKLVNNAASLVLYKDGTVNIGQWGRDVGPADLPNADNVRQNLELLVDNGQLSPAAMDPNHDWGALLKNIYFVWRSGFGITKDGALVFVGGPALQPKDLAQRLIDAGAVRGMEMDINPEWVTANLYSVGLDGKCHGEKGLGGPENQGGQRQPADRYLSTDTRDFVAVFTKPN